jgi:hypothetical protein
VQKLCSSGRLHLLLLLLLLLTPSCWLIGWVDAAASCQRYRVLQVAARCA